MGVVCLPKYRELTLGKSTLIKLLTRLFEPTEGEILINDVDIKNYNRQELYEKMSVLFQDYRIRSLLRYI